MYEQVTDYTTVGQNPLAFIRYYNSMAMRVTLATELGRNWRTTMIVICGLFRLRKSTPNAPMARISVSCL